MNSGTALVATLISGGLAVAIVAVDLQFKLDGELQTLENGAWVTASKNGYYSEPIPGPFGDAGACPGPSFRLWVHNDSPLAKTIRVNIGYYNGTKTVTELDTEWRLGGGEIRTHEFTVTPATVSQGSPKERGNVYVSVGNLYFNSCVEAA